MALAVLPAVAVAQQPSEQEGDTPTGVEFTAREKAWLAAHPLIRVGAETNYAPYEFQDSRKRFSGVVADYMEILKRQLGVRFEVRQMPDFATVTRVSAIGASVLQRFLPRTTILPELTVSIVVWMERGWFPPSSVTQNEATASDGSAGTRA
jgi:hypothetical protein